jgi:hypothetical protein
MTVGWINIAVRHAAASPPQVYPTWEPPVVFLQKQEASRWKSIVKLR